MAISVEPKRGAPAVGRAVAVEQKVVPGVVLWGALGALFVAFEAYVLIKWVTGPNFENVPAGPTPVPDGMKIAGNIVTWGGAVAMVYLLWRVVVKPYRQTKTVSSSALLLVWFATFSWFLDPFANMFSGFFTYNSWFPNMGSWVADIPFWQSITAGSPGAMQAYPLFFVVTAYVWGLWGVVAAQAWTMRKMREKWPAMSTAMLVFWSFWWGFAVFALLEIVYMRVGMYGYHAAVPELTLWYGEYYQLPIYECLFAGFWCLGYASLLYFRNDKGETVVERGMEKVKVGSSKKIGLRFLAITGMATVIYMVTYNIPYWITNMATNEPWPKENVENSYWTNGICGPANGLHCGGGALPLQGKDLGRFDSGGKLVLPAGVTIPQQVTEYKTSK